MLWFLAALLIQSPDEVRISSHDYVPQASYTLRVDTKLVEITAVVRDSHGKTVAGLTKDNFHIIDDRKERLIDHFVVENTLKEALIEPKSPAAPGAVMSGVVPAAPVRPPRFLALFFDDVNSNDAALGGGLKQTHAAAKKFIVDALKGNVRMGVFTASGAQTVDFTTDEAKLLDAIAALKAHPGMKEDGIVQCPRITPYYAYRISEDHDETAIRAVMFDAGQKHCGMPRSEIITHSDETWRQVQAISTDTLNSIGRLVVRLGSMPGKREIVLASSGFLGMTLQPLKDKIIDRALRASVVINALDAKGIYMEPPPGMRAQDAGFTETGVQYGANSWIKFETAEMPLRLEALSEPMGTLTAGTGGFFYHNNNDFNAGFRELGGEPEVIYHLGFKPEGVIPDGAFHKLKVSLVHSKNYAVQARPGYFAPTETAQESAQSKIDREVLAEDTVAGFPMGIVVQGTQSAFSVALSFDISKFRFLQKDGRQMQRILFTTALIDGQGKVAAAKEGQIDLALTDAGFRRLAATPVKATVTFAVPAGVYRLREVAEEVVDGRIASSTHSIAIR